MENSEHPITQNDRERYVKCYHRHRYYYYYYYYYERKRKGEDVPSDEEECTDIVLSSKTRVENLEVVSRRKVNRRRPRKTRVWFNDGTFATVYDRTFNAKNNQTGAEIRGRGGSSRLKNRDGIFR